MGGTLTNGVSALTKETQRLPCPFHQMRAQQEVGSLQPLTDTESAATVNLGLPRLQNCEELFSIVYKPTSLQ